MAGVRGVVEGFYGRPYTPAQRRIILQSLRRLRRPLYVYAPKSDPWHRRLWRRPYPDGRWAELEDLFASGGDAGVEVHFGLSPAGAVLRDAGEVRRKLSRAVDAGAAGVCLLFDDQLDSAGAAVAQRHADLAAAAAGGLGVPVSVCPAVYCTELERRMEGEGYIRLISRLLPEDWNVMWTGREVVSPHLDAPDLDVPGLRRPPLVWDNLLADDYCLRRIYLAPLEGRIPEGCGYLLNPSSVFLCALHAVRELLLASGVGCPWPEQLGAERDGWRLLAAFHHTPWSASKEGDGMVAELVAALAKGGPVPAWLASAADSLKRLIDELPGMEGGFDLMPYVVDLGRLLAVASQAMESGAGAKAELHRLLLRRLPCEHPLASALLRSAEDEHSRGDGA